MPQRGQALGIACGIGAVLCWAGAFTAAKHGLDIGMTPVDLLFHRFWPGILLLPLALRAGLADLGGIGWSRGLVLTVLGGPGVTILSYTGFTLVPLGHGGIIQPACAALFGLALASLMLRERLPLHRLAGALAIVAGLAVIAGEAVATIGVEGVAGDLMFVVAGGFFATFGMLLRKWRLAAVRATVAVSFVSLAVVPAYAAMVGFGRIAALGFMENLLQAVIQGLLAGPAAIYFYTRAVIELGAGRAAMFTALVPPGVLLVGWLALGENPTWAQLAGLVVVLVGFRLTQRA